MSSQVGVYIALDIEDILAPKAFVDLPDVPTELRRPFLGFNEQGDIDFDIAFLRGEIFPVVPAEDPRDGGGADDVPDGGEGAVREDGAEEGAGNDDEHIFEDAGGRDGRGGDERTAGEEEAVRRQQLYLMQRDGWGDLRQYIVGELGRGGLSVPQELQQPLSFQNRSEKTVRCNKVKRFPCGGPMNYAGIMEGGRWGGGEVGGRRGWGVGGGGGRWGGGGKERGERGIRMNHGAFAWGEFHFVTASKTGFFRRDPADLFSSNSFFVRENRINFDNSFRWHQLGLAEVE